MNPDTNFEAAHAKLTLSLRILGQRSDGYHDLHIRAVFLDLVDRLTYEANQNPFAVLISGDHAFDGDPKNNLVYRAAHLFAQHAHKNFTGTIHLQKSIPVAAGLGGGSADAAAALRLLNRVWNLNLPLPELARLGAKLGADIPMCVYSQPLEARGIGEEIQLVPYNDARFFVLVHPDFGLNTAEVFGRYKSLSPAERNWGGNNDLAPAAISVQSFMKEILEACAGLPQATVHGLAGSGSTVFAGFGVLSQRDAAVDILRKSLKNCTIRPVRLAFTPVSE